MDEKTLMRMGKDVYLCCDIHGHNCTWCSRAAGGHPTERCMEELLLDVYLELENERRKNRQPVACSMVKKDFIATYCVKCGSQRCEGPDDEFAEGCPHYILEFLRKDKKDESERIS